MILGLDIGTNSIGWAILDFEAQKIVKTGVRIFPKGTEPKTEEPKNKQRRAARGTRRNFNRYVQRRKRLELVLKELGMMPKCVDTDAGRMFEIDQISENSGLAVYALRTKALDKKLGLEELGRILLHLNQRRGFKSNRKEKSAENEKELGELKSSIANLEATVENAGFRTMGEYFYHLLQNRPINFEEIEKAQSEALKAQKKKKKQVEDDDFEEEPIEVISEKIRRRPTSRKLYEEEFDRIWEKQQTFYPEILTGAKGTKDQKTAYWQIREAIFWQRKLKSQKHTRAKCRFEPKRTCCPKAAFEFQEFRIWQKLQDLEYTDEKNGRYKEKLTLEQKIKLADAFSDPSYLDKKGQMSFAKISKLLGFSNSTSYNLEKSAEIPANKTVLAFKRILGEDYEPLATEYHSATTHEAKRKTKMFQMWHALLYAENEDWLFQYGIEKLGLSTEQARTFSRTTLEPDHANLSLKAMQNIMVFMKADLNYSDSCREAGYHHSYDVDLQSRDRKLLDKIKHLRNHELRNPVVQQALAETIRLVNTLMKTYQITKIRIETTRELKKNKEERLAIKSRNEATEKRKEALLQFLKDKGLIDKNAKLEDKGIVGKLQKYQLWLELGYENKVDLDKLKKISWEDLIKIQLWKETNRICPYTGKTISLAKLFSAEIEIEHIVPRKRGGGSDMGNLTLCYSEFNKNKNNLLPYEAFQSLPKTEWNHFLDRIKVFSKGKQERLKMEKLTDKFMASQLSDTAYIVKEMRKRLATVCYDVETSQGRLTAFLRQKWGFNDILSHNSIEEAIKNREDHRHHAVDAIVVACSDIGKTQVINRMNSRKEDWENENIDPNFVEMPWNTLRHDAEAHILDILVSHRAGKKLISKRKAKRKEGSLKEPKMQIGIRGELHEATYYGQIKMPKNAANKKFVGGENTYVIRKPIENIDKIEQIEAIVDHAVRKILINRLKEFGKDIETIDIKKQRVFAEPLFMPNKNGAAIPIRRVRMAVTMSNAIQLYPKKNPKLFVDSGNNYAMGIYIDPVSKSREGEIVSLYSAVQRKLGKDKDHKSILPAEKGHKKLFMVLKQGDMVLSYNNHEGEIKWDDPQDLSKRLYRVVKFSQSGIILGHHLVANLKADKEKEPIVLRRSVSTIKAIPVTVDILGNIKPKPKRF